MSGELLGSYWGPPHCTLEAWRTRPPGDAQAAFDVERPRDVVEQGDGGVWRGSRTSAPYSGSAASRGNNVAIDPQGQQPLRPPGSVPGSRGPTEASSGERLADARGVPTAPRRGWPPGAEPAGLAKRGRLVLLTLVLTGLRRSELCALDWRDLELDGRKPSLLVRSGKGGKSRRQPIPASLARQLQRLATAHNPEPTDPVFCGLQGGRLQEQLATRPTNHVSGLTSWRHRTARHPIRRRPLAIVLVDVQIICDDAKLLAGHLENFVIVNGHG